MEKEVGGLDEAPNKLSLPKRCQGYYSSKLLEKEDRTVDPLKEIIRRQHESGETGHPVIRKVQTNKRACI